MMAAKKVLLKEDRAFRTYIGYNISYWSTYEPKWTKRLTIAQDLIAEYIAHTIDEDKLKSLFFEDLDTQKIEFWRSLYKVGTMNNYEMIFLCGCPGKDHYKCCNVPWVIEYLITHETWSKGFTTDSWGSK